MHPGDAGNRLGLLLIAAVLYVVFVAGYDNFGTGANANAIALNSSSVLIGAMGSALLIITGNIDLSIGGIYSVVVVVTAQAALATGNALVAIVAGLVAGLVLGLVNGLLIRLLAISPLIVTVGTMILFEGLAYAITSGETLGNLPPSLVFFGRSTLVSIPLPVILALAVFAATAFVLTRTRLGLHIYGVGGNVAASELSGIPTRRLVLGCYTMNGLLIGLVGVLTAARIGIAAPNTGTGFEFDVLTAVILGGVAFNGGSGRPLGILWGIAAIGILNAGLIFAGLQFYYQDIAKGALLLVALGVDQFGEWRKERAATRAAAAQRVGHAETQATGTRRRHLPDPTIAARPPVLSARGLTKRYGAVVALDSADLDVRPGEVVCLLGDNGAGKSTLIKLISGAVRYDEGSVELDGRGTVPDSPAAMRNLGLETVYQDLALCGNLSVAHNLTLGNEPVRRLGGFLPVRDDKAAVAVSRERLSRLGVKLPSERILVEKLSGGQRQAVAIARALHSGVKVAIFDEPTAALGVHQTAAVIEAIRGAADAGTGVILISHDIDTVLSVADRLVVLRLGRVSYDGEVATLSQVDLLHLMAGIELEPATT